MLETQSKKIKIYFTLAVVLVLSTMLLGGAFIQNNYASDLESYGPVFNSYLKFLKYKIQFGGGLGLNSLSQVLDSSRSDYESARKKAEAVPVLVYHGITSKPDNSHINMTSEVFAEHMMAMKKAGYETISIDQLYRFLRGELTLPDKSFLVTFDDGRSDSVKNAEPILKALDYKAVMFAISKHSVDENVSDYYLTKADLKRMLKSGVWEIQAHTHDGHDTYPIDSYGTPGHFYTNKLWLSSENRLETNEEFNSRINDDISKVKNKLEQELGRPILGFAVPFGDFGQYTTNYPDGEEIFINSLASHYKLVFHQHFFGERFNSNYSTEDGRNQNFFLVERTDVDPDWSGSDLVSEITRIEPKSLPYTDDFSSNKGWILSWGDVQINPSGMTIKAKTFQSGGAVILDGSRAWKNYDLRANVEVPKRNSVYIWFRFKNDFNNAACNFGNGFIHIEHTTNGQHRVLKGIRDPSITIPGQRFEAGVRVKERNVECLINNTVVLSSPFLDMNLTQGGIGFKTWDTEIGESILTVKNINVTPI